MHAHYISKVPPAELEAVLLQHEAIKDAGVVGIPHKESGEVPLAFVVVQPGKTVTELNIKDFIAERVSFNGHLQILLRAQYVNRYIHSYIY